MSPPIYSDMCNNRENVLGLPDLAQQNIAECSFQFRAECQVCKFRRQFANSPVPDKTTIYRLVKKFKETGSVQNKKPHVNKGVLTIEEKLDEISLWLEQSFYKFLCH
ncbi:hypothetical protein ANN_02246 [Periplaneta americana]|uniref:DUF4817 domain-containing protein n=1 Tax=Periplaneta americana TaxID=6978 RepID=A0ABQ8TXE3_PERAM|nr:hypothetical protein ANN_02246 [Periplaneta americana]